MRLIDADATKRRVADTYFDTLIPCVNHALDDSPTIDAVPVVRCRECKHYKERKEISMKCCYVHLLTPHPMKEDDFCSFGERSRNE